MAEAIQFTRKDLSDGAIETLSLVRLDYDGSLAVQIVGGTPDEPGEFVGLYDLDGDGDGDQLQLGNESWKLVEGEALTGHEACEVAHDTGAALRAHADPTGSTDRDISLEAALELLEQDPALVYLPLERLFEAWECGNTAVQRWEPEAA
jgi:hypothetical protein